jgi:chitin synthase
MLIHLNLGNRPQGSNGLYIGLSVVFSVHMMFVFGLLVYQLYVGISDITLENFRWQYFLTQSTLRDLILGLGSTFGFYFLSSLLYLDPWHMITCTVQYLILLPTWINILMVYSFTNINDFSWGTKGDNTPLQSLHIDAFTKQGGQNIRGIFSGSWDANVVFQASLDMLRSSEDGGKKSKDGGTKRLDDYFR